MVCTASHNPKEYNGYKAYWNDGGQLVPPHDKNVITEVEDLLDVKRELVAALKECRKVLDALPITVSDTAGVYRCTALIDTAIAKAKNV